MQTKIQSSSQHGAERGADVSARSACLLTTPTGKRAPRQQSNVSTAALSDVSIYTVKPRITHIDRVIIRDYFRNAACVPSLPPAALPRDLEDRLSTLSPGYIRLTVARGVVLVDTATSRMVDILRWDEGSLAENVPRPNALQS